LAVNPNWARWVFASLGEHLKKVATQVKVPVLIEGFDERTSSLMQAADRVEIRITGPYCQPVSKDFYRLFVDANVLLVSRYGNDAKNAFDVLNLAGLYQEALGQTISVYNYGNKPGDYTGLPSTLVHVGCLRLSPGKSVQVTHFGQVDRVDKIKHTEVQASYTMELTT